MLPGSLRLRSEPRRESDDDARRPGGEEQPEERPQGSVRRGDRYDGAAERVEDEERSDGDLRVRIPLGLRLDVEDPARVEPLDGENELGVLVLSRETRPRQSERLPRRENDRLILEQGDDHDLPPRIAVTYPWMRGRASPTGFMGDPPSGSGTGSGGSYRGKWMTLPLPSGARDRSAGSRG